MTGNNGSSGAFIWVERAQVDSNESNLARELKCPEWFAALLSSRGITTMTEAQAWLQPKLKNLGDPFVLPDMDIAVDRILQAIDRQERVTIFGDYDVDGLTSVALLYAVLKPSGIPISTFLPHRMEEGYGLSLEALDRCIEQTQPALIITVDCGTNSVPAVQEAKSRGIDVIITDHHTVGDEMAPAIAVVNPRRSSHETLHMLAGVGVAFKLAHAVLKRARQSHGNQPWTQFDPKELLDLVALGTIADLVPMIGENRLLVYHGLKVLNQTRRIGIRSLINAAKITNTIDTYEVGYLLGPRLNAAGRLGTAQTSLKLLLTENQAEADDCALFLDEANRERQQVEKDIVKELSSLVETRMSNGPIFSIVEGGEHWHPGVVGIAASRMVQQHCRPTIVIGMDDQGRAKGSCRSIAGFNLVEALTECGDLLVKYGGHAMAAGLEIEWDKIDAFREKFESVAARYLSGQQLAPRLNIDGWISLRDISDHVIELLEQLRPFGIGYPEPLWGCHGMAISGQPREVGKGHLKARFTGQGVEMDAIGFGLFHRPLPEGPLKVAFHLRREVFRGRENLVMHVKDFHSSA